MIVGFKKTRKILIISIMFVLLLLSVCVSVDYATNETIDNMNESKAVEFNDTNVVNGTYYIGVDNGTKVTKIDKVITEKSKIPMVTITCKPSCGCGRYSSYTWRTRTFVNYCPHCHRYGVLYNAHKRQAKYEQELTCRYCGADYCGNCGHEKYSWSKYYLRKA